MHSNVCELILLACFLFRTKKESTRMETHSIITKLSVSMKVSLISIC